VPVVELVDTPAGVGRASATVLRPAGGLGAALSRNGGRGRRSLWSSATWPPPDSSHEVAGGGRACGRRRRPGDPATGLFHPATGKILPTKLPGPCGTRGS